MEISEVIRNLKKKKSPGIDSITNEIIQLIYETDSKFFEKLYNKCLEISHFPTLWKKARIKLIIKNVDKPRNDINNYRPIALLPNMGKILEKLVIERINS
jgi:hypothetical protein